MRIRNHYADSQQQFVFDDSVLKHYGTRSGKYLGKPDLSRHTDKFTKLTDYISDNSDEISYEQQSNSSIFIRKVKIDPLEKQTKAKTINQQVTKKPNLQSEINKKSQTPKFMRKQLDQDQQNYSFSKNSNHDNQKPKSKQTTDQDQKKYIPKKSVKKYVGQIKQHQYKSKYQPVSEQYQRQSENYLNSNQIQRKSNNLNNQVNQSVTKQTAHINRRSFRHILPEELRNMRYHSYQFKQQKEQRIIKAQKSTQQAIKQRQKYSLIPKVNLHKKKKQRRVQPQSNNQDNRGQSQADLSFMEKQTRIKRQKLSTTKIQRQAYQLRQKRFPRLKFWENEKIQYSHDGTRIGINSKSVIMDFFGFNSSLVQKVISWENKQFYKMIQFWLRPNQTIQSCGVNTKNEYLRDIKTIEFKFKQQQYKNYPMIFVNDLKMEIDDISLSPKTPFTIISQKYRSLIQIRALFQR